MPECHRLPGCLIGCSGPLGQTSHLNHTHGRTLRPHQRWLRKILHQLQSREILLQFQGRGKLLHQLQGRGPFYLGHATTMRNRSGIRFFSYLQAACPRQMYFGSLLRMSQEPNQVSTLCPSSWRVAEVSAVDRVAGNCTGVEVVERASRGWHCRRRSRS